MSKWKDYYSVLGISKSSDKKEIKKAYLSLAKKFHPDKFQDAKEKEEAQKKFQEVQQAYDVLSDDQKKSAYDSYGHEAYTSGGTSGAGFSGGSAGGFDFSGFEGMFNDFFSGFDGGGRGSSQSYSRAVAGEDLRYSIEISLEEAFEGKSFKVKIPRMISCSGCDGYGSEKSATSKTCHSCNGTGSVSSRQMFFNIQQTCPKCNGKGKTAPVCKKCRGECRVHDSSEINIEVPKGVQDGMQLRMSGKGNAGLEGGPNGSLFVFINVKKHSLFSVQDSNLLFKMPISVHLAVLGGEVEIPTIKGEKTTFKIPAGSQTGTVFTIKGKGMPKLRSSYFGDIFVTIEIEVPTNISADEKELWLKIQEKNHQGKKTESFFKKVKDFLAKKI